ncbi:hypothetical protein ACTSEZ_16595 [Metabacillus sp. JX24]
MRVGRCQARRKEDSRDAVFFVVKQEIGGVHSADKWLNRTL